jgi:bifunctional non-homologous end joining protein LigD
VREGESAIRVGGRDVKITRPEKVLFPDDGITKQDLVDYYRRAAQWILPHLRERPLTLERFPDGIHGSRIIQKSAASYFPRWIETVSVAKVGGSVRHVICNDEATLVYLANLACITPHIWLSRIDKCDYPDQMVLDLDPSGASFAPVVETAKAARKLLEQLGLPAYVKTTGSRGLHVVVPLKRQEDFDSVRAFARQVAEVLVNQSPNERTLEQRKDKRGQRVFIDINRNAYAQTVAPAYAVRPRPRAPVSAPLDWRELDEKSLRPDGVTIRNIFQRLEKMRKTDDPWKDLRARAASLKQAAQELRRL